MSTIIKAPRGPATAAGVAFNFDDLTRQAEGYLERVRGQAAEIIKQAQQQATEIRNGAVKLGRDDAHRAAVAELEMELERQLVTLLPAIRQAAERIEQSRQECLAQWERGMVRLAAAIAARVIRRELVQQPDIPLALIREALELAAGGTKLRLCLNPADHAALAGQAQRIVAEMSQLGGVEIVADAAISPAGCRVETRHGSIDQQIESQLARIEEELTGEAMRDKG